MDVLSVLLYLLKMKKFPLVFFVLLFSAFTLHAQQALPQYVDGAVYVKLKDDQPITFRVYNSRYVETGEISLLDGIDTRRYGIYKAEAPFYFSEAHRLMRILRISFNNKELVNALIDELASMPEVEYAERIPLDRLDYTPNDIGSNATTGSGQWFLHRIKAQDAWEYSKGDSTITVAVIDDEVQITHPDLKDNIWVNPGEIAGNGIDDDNNGYIDDVHGWDAADWDNDPSHPNSAFTHGTHVSGCASASTDNGTGVAAIGFNVAIMAVKCTYNSQTDPRSIPEGYRGITYAAKAGADIINCSWSSYGTSNANQDVIEWVRDSTNSIIVAAASNDALESIVYPGGYPSVVCVASSDFNEEKSWFSNYGSWVDVIAPGSDIRSTYVSNTYQIESGTSMATPVTAGLLALMKSYNQDLPATDLVGCLIRNTDKTIFSNSPAMAGKIGSGRIDAEKAMRCVDSSRNSKPKTRIDADHKTICPNNEVKFIGKSVAGYPQTYSWSFPGGVPSSSTAASPKVSYASKGSYDVSLIITNPFGSDTLELNDFITVSADGRSVVYSEDFENGTLASLNYASNTTGSKNWELTATGGISGSSRSLKVDLFDVVDSGTKISLITPKIDLSGSANARLSFNYAYTSSATNLSDTLKIYASTDDGATFPILLGAWYESNSMKFFTRSVTATEFIPALATDWCHGSTTGASCMQIDLGEFDFQQNFRLKFELSDMNGNNFYLDNITVDGNCASYNTDAPAGAVNAISSSGCAPLTVKLKDISANYPSSRTWIIHGLTDSVYHTKNLDVVISAAGDYDVSLIVENAYGKDSIRKAGLISVLPNPQISVTVDPQEICKGKSSKLTASGASTYVWSPIYQLSSTTGTSVNVSPAFNFTYNVTGTGSNGCKSVFYIPIAVKPAPGKPNIRIEDNKLKTDSLGYTYRWYYSNTEINNANGTEIILQSGATGNYKVEATGPNGCGTMSNDFYFGGFAGIQKDISNLFRMAYMPNHQVQVTLSGNDINLELFDISGRMLRAFDTQAAVINLDMAPMPAGLYLLRATRGGQTYVQKLVNY